VLVRNQGICGNRLVLDPPERCMFFGEAGVRRLEPDILADLGTTHLIMALGGNDIGLSYPSPFFGELGGLPSDEQFREACTDVVARLHAHGIRAYTLSIYPGVWSHSDPEGADATRIRFNAILKDCFDGYIDLENVLSDGNGYKPGYGLADGIHLADAGGEAAAAAIFAWLKENSDLFA
jgi:lysophospholipase L1-like esterase